MANISVLAQLVDLASNTALATTANLVDWSASWLLDKACTHMIEVFAAEPGDALNGATSFATYLLNGGTGATGNTTPVLTLERLSLDGGTLYDSSKIVEAPRRLLTAAGPHIQESGDDIWSLYATLGVDRATYTQAYLCDVLYKATGTIGVIVPRTPTVAGGAGALSWKITQVTHGVESIASAASATGALGATITIPLGGSGTTARRLYRNSIATPGIWRLTHVVMGNSAATYVDSNADATIAGNAQPPQSYGFFSTGTIPLLQGLFNTLPGNPYPTWAAGAQARLTFTPVLDPSIAFLQTNLDIYASYIAMCIGDGAKAIGGAFDVADDVTQGSRGHYVADSSDGLLNLSSAFAGVVCDGTPTIDTAGGNPGPAGTNGYSNAAGRGYGVSRALVLGSRGAQPGGSAFTFDGSSSASLTPTQEAHTARIWQDQVTITPSLQNYWQQASFVGGSTNGAGLPPDYKITCITTLNDGTPGSPSDAATACLPLVGIAVGDVSGGLYMSIGDNQFVPYPQSPNLPVYDLTVDTVNNLIYIATTIGVFKRNTTVTDFTTPWTQVGGLRYKVTRLAGLVDVISMVNTFCLYALATGNQKGQDGIYVLGAASAPTGAGYDGWGFWHPSPSIIDVTATDGHSFFFLTLADNGHSLHLYDNTTKVTTPFALPANVYGSHLDRVITAAAGMVAAQDSVWVTTQGDNQPAYYLLKSGGGAWIGQTMQPGNKDLSLYGADGSSLVVANRFVGLGRAFNSVVTAALACTSNGLFYLPLGSGIPGNGAVGWVPANGVNGLDGVNVIGMAAGQVQNMRGSPTSTNVYDLAPVQRVFAITPTAFYQSSSTAAFWRDIVKEPLSLGPFFTQLAYDVSGALPTNSLLTIGPMASSPLGGPSGTHLQAAVLPTGWYWWRLLDERSDWTWRLVNSNVSLPGVMYHALANLQTNASVPQLTASAQVATVLFAWLKDNSQPQTLMSIESSFTQDTAGLRKVRPTMAVLVTLSASLLAKALGSGAVTTPLVSMSAQTWYVLEHHIRAGDARGSSARTTTLLGSQLKTTPITPDDIAAALTSRLHNVQRFGLASAG